MSAAFRPRPTRSPTLACPALTRADGAGDLELDFLTSLFAELSGLPAVEHPGRQAAAGTAPAGAGKGAGPPERE